MSYQISQPPLPVFVPRQRRMVTGGFRRALPPVVRNIAPRSRAPVGPRKPQNDVFDDLSQALLTSVGKPAFMITLAICAVLVVTHAGDLDNGPIGKLFPKDSTNQFVIWVRENTGRFFGALIFAPTLVDAPQKTRPLLIAAVTVWILFVPESSDFEYMLQAVLFFLYFHVKLRTTKFLLIGAVLVAYLGGYVFKDPKLNLRIRADLPDPLPDPTTVTPPHPTEPVFQERAMPKRAAPLPTDAPADIGRGVGGILRPGPSFAPPPPPL